MARPGRVGHDALVLDTAATALLTLLDPLDYPSRMRSLTAETRRLVAEGGLDEVLDELTGERSTNGGSGCSWRPSRAARTG